jgi:hypothetical protein
MELQQLIEFIESCDFDDDQADEAVDCDTTTTSESQSVLRDTLIAIIADHKIMAPELVQGMENIYKSGEPRKSIINFL